MEKIKIYNSIRLFFIMFGFLVSCTDTVDVNVPNSGARLVVDATITWEKGTSGQTQTIKLRESTAYFDNNPDVPVTGAMVTVTKDDDGSEFAFQDQNNGAYITNNFDPQVGQSYTLSIQHHAQTYTAQETLIPVSNINSVVQTIEGTGDDTEIQLQVFFDDPEGTANYYLGEFTPSNLPLPALAAINDEFTDGNENFIENDNENYLAGVTVGISLYGVSERYYDYINILIDQSGSDEGGPFATTPVQLKGNCINVTNSDEEVLGYFRLGEVSTTSYTIE